MNQGAVQQPDQMNQVPLQQGANMNQGPLQQPSQMNQGSLQQGANMTPQVIPPQYPYLQSPQLYYQPPVAYGPNPHMVYPGSPMYPPVGYNGGQYMLPHAGAVNQHMGPSQVPPNQAAAVNQWPVPNAQIPHAVQNASQSTESHSSASTPLKQLYVEKDSGVASQGACTSSSETPLKQPVTPEDVHLQDPFDDPPHFSSLSLEENNGNNRGIPPLRSVRTSQPILQPTQHSSQHSTQRSLSSPAPSSTTFKPKKSKKSKTKSDSECYYSKSGGGGPRFKHSGLQSSYTTEFEDAFRKKKK